MRQSRACFADVMGVLTIHVTFKAGVAELLRFYTKFKRDKHAKTLAVGSNRQGTVGMLLAEG